MSSANKNHSLVNENKIIVANVNDDTVHLSHCVTSKHDKCVPNLAELYEGALHRPSLRQQQNKHNSYYRHHTPMSFVFPDSGFVSVLYNDENEDGASILRTFGNFNRDETDHNRSFDRLSTQTQIDLSQLSSPSRRPKYAVFSNSSVNILEDLHTVSKSRDSRQHSHTASRQVSRTDSREGLLSSAGSRTSLVQTSKDMMEAIHSDHLDIQRRMRSMKKYFDS